MTTTPDTLTRAPTNLHQAIAPITPGAVDRTRRTVAVVASSELVDRAGDRILADGWQLDAYRRNPVVLFAHRDREPPIGRAIEVAIRGGRLTAVLQFADADTYPFADQVFRLVADGYLNAVSVGFRPLAWNRTTDPTRKGGKDISQQELLEISVVPVPCLPDARVVGRGVSSLSRLALARAIGRGVARAIQALKQGGRHDERHPAGSPGGVGGQFAPGPGGGGTAVSGGDRGRGREAGGGSDGGVILVSGSGGGTTSTYRQPDLSNLPDRVSVEYEEGGRRYREVVTVQKPTAIPETRIDGFRKAVLRHGLQKHARDASEWGKTLSDAQYEKFFNEVMSKPERAAKLADGRSIYERAVGDKGERVVVIINENQMEKSTMFAPNEEPNKRGGYFDRVVGENWKRKSQNTKQPSRRRSMESVMEGFVFSSSDIDDDVAEHLFLMSSILSWSIGGAAGMVLAIEKTLPKPRSYFKGVADGLLLVASSESPRVYNLHRDDLITIKNLMIYQRDVYDIAYEMDLVTGFSMDQFHETLRWVEGKLADLA